MSKEKVFKFDAPEQSPGFLLWQLSNLWQRKINHALIKVGLTHVQFVLLASLYWFNEQGQVVNQVKLAEHSKTDKMMTSKVLGTLQKKGFITREEDKKDTRAKNIFLTEEGKNLVRQTVRVVENIDREFFSAVKDQENFNKIMHEIITIAEKK